ncbi:MAG TPA: cytochrome P450 [Amycolatopsis sp.]|nr:cytochrome P450 [Amycolatopsis sp.]
MTIATELPIIRSSPFAPPEEHRRLQDEARISRVVLPSGHEVWALTHLEDVRAMLSDPRFSSDRYHPNFPLLIGSARPTTKFPTSLISLDPPEHGPARRAVVGEFTVKRMAALRPRIQEIVDEHIDAMLAGPRPADLVPALSLPVPSLVICELLGVPYADHDFFQSRTAAMLKRVNSQDVRTTAAEELRAYLDDLVERKEQSPGEDLLSRQLDKAENHESLVSLAFLLLLAGHETTANMISLGTMTLLQNPAALAVVRDNPDRTLSAVEELLRFFTIAEFATARVAKEDIEIAGVLIQAGDGVLGLGNVANRDPDAFANPDELDLERGARHHVSFGFGPHQCLGQNLARMELEIVFNTLFRRIPGLRLAAPVEELPFKDDAAVYGLYELPVTW